MIVSLRGTNGAGKSTIVREIMKSYWSKVLIQYAPERTKPMGYILRHKTIGLPALFVPGHYEIANGGVDTLPSLDVAYEMIRVHALEMGCHVIYEGKNMSDGPNRLIELHREGLDVRAILIDLPLKQCVASVRKRGHHIKEETIARLHKKSARDIEKIEAAGIDSYELSREEAVIKIKSWLQTS